MGFFSRIFGGKSEGDSEEAPAGPSGSKSKATIATPAEAASLARLLVTEILLYNEELVVEARQRGNVYAALKDDIDRSRAMYDAQVKRSLMDKDYFHLELVTRLAGGRPEILGLPSPDGR